MANEVMNSYVGMSHRELRDAWMHSGAVRGSDYTAGELAAIDRKWRSLGKKIALGAAVRIPDGSLNSGNKRRKSA